MGVSASKVAVISAFLILGMLLAGVITQPKTSLEAWSIKERDFPDNASSEEKLTFLLGYAILAPSSHNSQPWKFNVSGDEIRIYADRSRRLDIADADQRELFISIGCALENLLIAADHFGYNSSVEYFPGHEDLVAKVLLQPGARSSLDSRLFDAILSRQTNRNPYEARKIADGDLIALQNLSSKEEARIFLTADSATKKKFLNLTVQADRIQYSDANYKSELGHWLGQGIMGPTGIQAKIAQLAVVFLDMGPEQIKKDAEIINSTPYLGFISTNGNSSEASVKAGRTLERMWLMATALGISLHPMSQALEVAKTKKEISDLLPAGAGDSLQLQQTFRLGYAKPVEEHTPRRGLEEVLI